MGVMTTALIHLRSLWRQRWWAVAIAWLVCIAGWGIVFVLHNQYEAKARFFVDAESLLRPLLRGLAVDTSILTQVDLMQRTLLSRPNLLQVARMADLDPSGGTSPDVDATLADLRQRIVLVGDGHGLFTLSYTGPDREGATRIVQALLTVFVESSLGNSRKDMSTARSFIDDQLQNYSRLLDAAEQRIAEFKANNVGFLPGENNYSTKLDGAKHELDKDKAELDETQRKRDELAKQLTAVPKYTDTFVSTPGDFGAGPPLGPPLAGPGGDAEDASADQVARVAELERKLRQLLENDTEQHPDVIRTRRQLEQAKEALAKAQAEKAAKAPRDAPQVDPRARRNTVPNPVYEQLQLQLVSLDSSIASLGSRVDRAKADVDKWEKLAKSVPEVGAELSKLTRDYDVIRKAYDELLSRRESAKIGSDVEAQTQTVQFRIVEPPGAPIAPVAPNRKLLLSAVLVGGILSGAAFAFLLSQTSDSVATIRQLKEIVSVPVLGAVSLAAGASRANRAALAGFAFLCLGLVGVYVGVLSFEILRSPHA
jgi:polysaccharide chain length determinant protein (PEP-CTERM system associated)